MLAVALYFWRARNNGPTTTGVKSIAVLPFKPLVASERDESLEMGMADTLITRLSSIGQLTVRPTSAVRQYAKLEDEAVKAGRELMVDAVLDGSIQKAGDRVRVSVRLVRVEQGQTLWAQQFDEKFTDIFTVQDAISRRVADMLALRLSGEENERLAKRGTDNPEAYQAYLLRKPTNGTQRFCRVSDATPKQLLKPNEQRKLTLSRFPPARFWEICTSMLVGRMKR